jgi:ATP-dependent Clp protease ATP-binding subunit ClpC
VKEMWHPTQGNHADGFSDRAIRMLEVATDCAAARHHVHVTPEHVLWALGNVRHGPGFFTLKELGLDVARQSSEIEALLPTASVAPAATPTPSGETVRLLREAKLHAQALGHSYVGSEHLVLGLLTCGSCPAADYLRQHGVDVENFRETAVRLLSGE